MGSMNLTKIPDCLRRSALVICFLVVASAASSVSGASFSSLFAFGDSLSDRGNTYAVFGGHPADSAVYSLLSYTASAGRYDDGRWSNGKVWVEHLNNSLGLPSLERNKGTDPLISGKNFAYGGSTTGTGSTLGVINNLQLQVSNYLSLAGGTASSTALYSLWSGGNDVIYHVEGGGANTAAAINTLTDTMATDLNAALTTLYNAGARHFIIPNLPALGEKPSYVGTPHEAFANSIVAAYNPKLETKIVDFRTAHDNVKIAAWDVNSLFTSMLESPALYGFTNVTEAAFTATAYPGTVVANPNLHVFWDQTHPSAAGHQILGQLALNAVTILLIPEPSTFVMLNVGIVAIGGRVRSRARGSRR